MPILEPFHQVKTTTANLTCADHIANAYRYIDCHGQGYAKDPYQGPGQGFLCSGLLVQDLATDGDIEAIFSRANQLGAVERPVDLFLPSSSSRSLTGIERFLSAFLENIRNAKCFYTAKNFPASKEFVVSLGALDSNKALLRKILNQPDSMFAKRLHDLYAAPEFHYGHVRSMNSSALKHNANIGGCQIGMEASGKIYIHFLSGVEAVSLCENPTIQIQLGRLASVTSDRAGCNVWNPCARKSRFRTSNYVCSIAVVVFGCGIAKSSLTTSSSPSPLASMSLLKILELEVLKFLLLKGFTHARRSSGRKTSNECVLLGEYVSCLDNCDNTKLRVMGNISAGADGSSNCTFFRAVLLVRRGTYDEARGN
ncbi:hypothetical protein Nepgr_029375 [Nepenthes gracilis]|uniref:Uncharacterized protein n=1 Tax=Nepenthes gracilis TaxID=150966 RepID=A0AAD3TDV4_NEPGR|nr:hypothetical protein Nepgr_029375 [Nepenthes gracilis]